MSKLIARAAVPDPHFPLLDSVPIAMLMAGSQNLSQLASTLDVRALPTPGQVLAHKGATLVWAGPRQWLVLGDIAHWAPQPHGYISNQSDGRAIFLLQTEIARTLLPKGTALDVCENAFPPGTSAMTKLAQFQALIWRDIEPEGLFHIAVLTSFAQSLNDWFQHQDVF